MAITLEQLDQLIAGWKQKIDLVGQNLIDLHGLPTYQRLTGEPGFPPAELSGSTKAQVNSALPAMNELFQHFELLVGTMRRAEDSRKQVSRFLGAEQKILEIEFLLTGDSIQLPVTRIPLAQRSLLTAPETAIAISPDQLLIAMTNAFEVARDVVLAVDEAWGRLATNLAATEAEIATLKTLATSLQITASPELATAEHAIAALYDQIDCDPLGVSLEFEQQLSPLIRQARTSLTKLAEQRTQIQAALQTARVSLEQLTDLNQRAIAACAERHEKVVDHSPVAAPLTADYLQAFQDWLARLDGTFAENSLHPVQIGLQNWNAKMAVAIATEQQTLVAHQQLIDRRQELRGRLDALKAKALARGRVEDETLSKLAEQAKQLLYARPTPLAQTAEFVRQYERRLNSEFRS
jgi:hypothetical protein